MEIKDIRNQWVKVGKTSITVKNMETGKTAGVVRNVTKFMDLQPNKQFEYSSLLRKSGFFESRVGTLDNIIVVDGKLYYLFNIHGLDFTMEHFPEEYNKKIDFVKKAREYIEVIEVEF